MNEVQRLALEYASHAWHVFPCYMGLNEKTGRPEKKAGIKEWQHRATTDPAKDLEFFARSGMMIGVAHRLTGTLALDIDRHQDDADGFDALADLEATGAITASGVSFTTASGGQQRLFVRPADRSMDALSGNYVGALGPGLDLIFGYSVAPSGPATPGREWMGGPFAEFPPYAPAWVRRPLDERDAARTARVMEILAKQPARPRRDDPDRAERYVLRVISEQAAIVGAYGDQTSGYNNTLSRAAILVGRAIGRTGLTHLLTDAEESFVRASARAASRHDHASLMTALAAGINTGVHLS